MTSFLMPAGCGSGEYTEKRSRFIGQLWPAESEAEALERIATLQAAFPHLDISQSAPQYIEVVAADSGKGNAVRALCRHLGIDVSRSVAFGDTTNDNSMLQAAGVGIAVDNATSDTKAVADRLCSDVVSCGVATVLEDIVAGKPIL